MSKFSVRARWIIPVEGPPLAGGVVTIEGDRIVEVGSASSSETFDLGDAVLFPGLVNAHTHLEFSDCDKPLGRPQTPLPDWIRIVIGTRHRSDRDAAEAIERGLAESLRAGVTTIGEISTCSPAAYSKFKGSHLLGFQEVIGFSAGRIDSVHSDLERRVDSASNAALEVGISPHAPYTVHPELLRRLVATAVARQLPVAMHLAESREELELLRDGSGPFQQLLADRSMWDAAAIPGGFRPLNYLELLAAAPRVLIIHGNYLDDEEIAFLAEHREHMSVVYCPRTHAYFGHDSYPLDRMLKAGVRVVLGTDSRASNPDLSLLAEMRFLARRYPQVSTSAILEMGTSSAAAALGVQSDVGSLVPGKLADLVALPCPVGVDPLDAVIHADAEPQCIYVRGARAAVG